MNKILHNFIHFFSWESHALSLMGGLDQSDITVSQNMNVKQHNYVVFRCMNEDLEAQLTIYRQRTINCWCLWCAPDNEENDKEIEPYKQIKESQNQLNK